MASKVSADDIKQRSAALYNGTEQAICEAEFAA